MRVVEFDAACANVAPTPQDGAPWVASLTLRCERRSDRSVLSERSHRGPLRLLKPLYPEGDRVCHAVIVHPPGGIVGGDELHTAVAVDANSHLLVTTPGAQKWYRSTTHVARAVTSLCVNDASKLEWMPQEAIVFSGAQVEQTIRVTLSPRSCFFGWDIVCFGRAARDERFVAGRYAQTIEISRGGYPIWIERMLLQGGDALLDSVVGFAGRSVVANAWIAMPSEADAIAVLETVQALFATNSLAGVSLVESSLVVVKMLGTDAESVRALLTEVWRRIRAHVFEMPPQPPRIWMT